MNSICFVIPDNSLGAYQSLSAKFSAIEPPTWALMLAESARKKGGKVSILDCLPMEIETTNIHHHIESINPDIVCYVVYGQNPNSSSANMHGVIKYSEALNKNARKKYFEIIIGPHVAALPSQTLKLHKQINAVSINEGVYTLHDLQKCNLNDKNDLLKVRGLLFRMGEDEFLRGKPGEIVPQDRIEIDIPGYAWDLLPFKEKPLDLYRAHLWHAEYNPDSASPFASLYTSFGCVFTCSFCMINIINKTTYDENISASKLNNMRFIPLSVIAKSLDFFAENGVKNVRICDEMFFFNPKHYQSILNYIIKKGYKFNMWAYARVDTIKQSQLELFKNAGINWLGVGIESASEIVRGNATKGAFSLNKILSVVNKTRSCGISVGSNFIVGLPSDTKQTCIETAELAITLSTEFINIYPCIDLPGSSIHVGSEREPSSNYLKYAFLSYETIPNKTANLTPREVLQIRDDLWHKIYSSPSVERAIQDRFGEVALKTVKNLRKIKLKRKLLN